MRRQQQQQQQQQPFIFLKFLKKIFFLINILYIYRERYKIILKVKFYYILFKITH